MHTRVKTGFCAGLIVFALALRICTAAVGSDELRAFCREKAQTIWRDALPIRIALAAELGQPVSPIVPATDEPFEVVIAYTPAPQPAPEAEQAAQAPSLTFTESDAAALKIGGSCSYDVDAATLLAAPMPCDFPTDGPQVLIIHTHGSEAYTPEPGWTYTPSDTLRTQENAYSVIRVGDAIAQELEARGIGVIHDTTHFDYPSYTGSYTRMLAAVEQWKAQYPTLRMVLDVHRDAANDANGDPVRTAVQIDGTSCARLMLVMGTDEGGLPHANWRGNLACAAKVQALLNRSAPGLCRELDLRTERFNQHATPCSMLVEVGSTGDTLRQALASAAYFADAVAAVIKSAENAG